MCGCSGESEPVPVTSAFIAVPGPELEPGHLGELAKVRAQHLHGCSVGNTNFRTVANGSDFSGEGWKTQCCSASLDLDTWPSALYPNCLSRKERQENAS